MEFTPYPVSSALFNGIKDRIDRLIKTHTNGRWSDWDSYDYVNLPVCLEWYMRNSVVSGSHLVEEYQKLKQQVDDKYFHYDLQLEHRFTMIYQLGDQTKENYNCLTPRKQFKANQIVLGEIIKYNGLYLRITEVFNIIDDKFGRFKAETLNVEELLKLKRKGGY